MNARASDSGKEGSPFLPRLKKGLPPMHGEGGREEEVETKTLLFGAEIKTEKEEEGSFLAFLFSCEPSGSHPSAGDWNRKRIKQRFTKLLKYR